MKIRPNNNYSYKTFPLSRPVLQHDWREEITGYETDEDKVTDLTAKLRTLYFDDDKDVFKELTAAGYMIMYSLPPAPREVEEYDPATRQMVIKVIEPPKAVKTEQEFEQLLTDTLKYNAALLKKPVYGDVGRSYYEDIEFEDVIEVDDAVLALIGKTKKFAQTDGKWAVVDMTAAELAERAKAEDAMLLNDLRARRASECFTIINRGQVWYETLTVTQKLELADWYNAWLNVTETRVVPIAPAWLEK